MAAVIRELLGRGAKALNSLGDVLEDELDHRLAAPDRAQPDEWCRHRMPFNLRGHEARERGTVAAIEGLEGAPHDRHALLLRHRPPSIPPRRKRRGSQTGCHRLPTRRR
jgi:hypothetical protein